MILRHKSETNLKCSTDLKLTANFQNQHISYHPYPYYSVPSFITHSYLLFLFYFVGGDFPEEMGQNLDAVLVIDNENILKMRKDEDSDE